MKISNETVNVLKNFATINTNILIREGNVLSTISTGKNMFARAQVAETFPKEFAIYDLNTLLALLTFMEDQEVDFGDKSLSISKEGGTFEYFYSDQSIIVAAPDKTIDVESVFDFKITAADVNMINKAAAIVGAPVVSVISKGGKVTMSVGDPKTAASNAYRKVIGECDVDFDARLDMENFKIIPEAYDVAVSKKLFHFKNDTKNLKYWIALNTDSNV